MTRRKVFALFGVLGVGAMVATVIVVALMIGRRADGPEAMAAQIGSGAPGSGEMSSLRGEAQQQGIQVRGHWIIEVRDPDGTLADRREFENALTLSGAELLAEIL
jgi:hypothetical protein